MSKANEPSTSQPTSLLIVDLDETLLSTDVLFEQLLLFLKKHPFSFWRILVWALKGKLELKRELSLRTDLSVATLPYRESIVELVRAEKDLGRETALISASHQTIVRKIGEHLGLFDFVIGSESKNLKGRVKLEAIRETIGSRHFRYAGDAKCDLEIWRESQGAVAVNTSPSVTRELGQLTLSVQEIRDRQSLAKLLLKQLRVHQWAKNGLLFLPLLAAHHFFDADRWVSGVLAFFAFSASASAVYVLNDLLDLEADRRHPRKRFRPFAAGTLPIKIGLLLLPVLAAVAIALSALLPTSFVYMILLYLVSNLAYSFYLKETLVLDVVFLGALYTIRVLAGGAATAIPVSKWLIAFSTFFFFGLAMLKRYIELDRAAHAGKIPGRSYTLEDRESIFALGCAGSLLSVLIIVLYLNGEDAKGLYQNIDRLWLVAPALTYWISRTWILGRRGLIHDDPVVFAIKDKATWIVLGVLAAILFSAI